MKYLRGTDGIQTYGVAHLDPQACISVISFMVAGRTSCSVLDGFEKSTDGNVGLRSGQFHSKRLINDVINLEGNDGVVKVSMVHCNICKIVMRNTQNRILLIDGLKDT